MRCALAVILLLLVGFLPAIDVVACPDGCSDAAHAATSWEHRDSCTASHSCGICLNTFALHSDVAFVIGVERLSPIPPAAASALTSTAPLAPDRPPRG